MRLAYRVGLALLVNVAIVAGPITAARSQTSAPLNATPSAPSAASAPLPQALTEGSRLLKSGSKSGNKIELTAAIAQFEQALKLSQPLPPETQNLARSTAFIGLARSYKALGDTAKALDYYNQAVPILLVMGERRHAATTLNIIGKLHRSIGAQSQALDAFNQALPIWRELGDRTREASTLNNIGSIYSDLGQLTKALDYYNQALPIAQAIGDRAETAAMIVNIGTIYADLGQPTKALDYYNQALPIWRAIAKRGDEATTLNNIGAAYNALADQPQALNYYNQALPIRRAIGDRAGEAATLVNLGAVYTDWGEKSKALDYYNQALLIFQTVGNRAAAARALSNIGLIYADLGDPTQALNYYNQALPIAQDLGDRLQIATTLNNFGNVYADQGELTKALAYYNQSLPLMQAIGAKSRVATILNNMGHLSQLLGQPTQALAYYQQSLPMAQAANDRSGIAISLNNLGYFYEQTGQRATALKYYTQALTLFQTIGDRSNEVNILSNLASLYRNQNQLPEALKTINSAIAIIESLRRELKTDALKTSYFAAVQKNYKLKIDILMQLHQAQPTQDYAAQALTTADQSRARVLRELLIQANANIRKDVDPALLQQEQTLNQTIDTQEKQLVQLSSQPGNNLTRLNQLNQSIPRLYAQRDDLKNTIRAANPAYANLQYPKPTTLAQIQQQLDPDTLILQYSLGETQSYLWVIGQTSLKTYILPKASDIKATAINFRKDLTTEILAPNSATQLAQQILAPAAADLGNKRLVIIPDRILHIIPFAALNTPNSKTYNPLITQHEITNLPSASTIGILRRTVATKPRGPKKLAILADPIFRKDDDRLAGKTIQANPQLDVVEQIARGRVGRDLDLNRLPFTATEAQGILKLVPDAADRTSAFGFDASYDWITEPRISQYRYIHLATHGFFDSESPARSSIILSSFDAQGRDRKAYLRFPDLFNLNLPAELVVLSACETGLGTDVPGEGLVGMTRGLMYAGALRVAVSLWSVDDQATSDLMQDFYTNLWQSKQSPAAALRQAQLKRHRQGQAPYYWAAFTLQGEWRN
jgi:CHAT domain-containing protein/predicted negative regulator of RcsB-dependent stress response